MKKIISLVLLFFYVLFLFPVQSNAQTIHDYKLELDALEKKERQTQEEIKLTQQQIENLTAEINQIYIRLDEIVDETTAKEKEIIELGIEIEEKDEEIKKIMNAYQISSGDLFYLEYLFGATSITDFILRYSITEQLTRYNDELIDSMNQKIEENKQIKIELAEKEKELKVKQTALRTKEKTLRGSTEELSDVYIDILDEIENAREVIEMYEQAGCGEYENLNVCAVNLIPGDSELLLPLVTGYMTSAYSSMRTVESLNYRAPHLAIDISNGEGRGSKVYAAANGKVFLSNYSYVGGGNRVCIHHNINGIGYSTCYYHLDSRSVSVGDIVSQNTVIGLMGSTGKYTTGPHVHFAVYKGLKNLTGVTATAINPASVISVPAKWVTWYNRNR